jgi:hypothetical protein
VWLICNWKIKNNQRNQKRPELARNCFFFRTKYFWSVYGTEFDLALVIRIRSKKENFQKNKKCDLFLFQVFNGRSKLLCDCGGLDHNWKYIFTFLISVSMAIRIRYTCYSYFKTKSSLVMMNVLHIHQVFLRRVKYETERTVEWIWTASSERTYEGWREGVLNHLSSFQ